jgi:hypothetical protein
MNLEKYKEDVLNIYSSPAATGGLIGQSINLAMKHDESPQAMMKEILELRAEFKEECERLQNE